MAGRGAARDLRNQPIACGEKLIAATQLILGELHGHRDFALLDYLQPSFHVGLNKSIKKRLFNFYAVNRRAPA